MRKNIKRIRVKQCDHYLSTELYLEIFLFLENAKLKRQGNGLFHAGKELQNNKEIVLSAVKQNGFALKFASYELRNDKEVVLAAVKQNRYALQYASDELKNNKDFYLL